MTQEEAVARLGEVETLAVRAREEGTSLTPLMVLEVCEGRAHPAPRVRPLSHDLEIPAAG